LSGVRASVADGDGNSFVNTINNSTYPNLVDALTKVRAKAPHARVAVSGYLQSLPPTTGCYPIMPVAPVSRPAISDPRAGQPAPPGPSGYAMSSLTAAVNRSDS
jgi:hypothetical protein